MKKIPFKKGKKLLSASISAVLFAAAGAAQAGDIGYAFDFVVGQADQNNSEEDSITISGIDTSQAIRFTLQFNHVVGLEIGYTDYGEISDDYVNEFNEDVTDYLETKAVNVGVAARFPVGDVANIVGRAGVASWDLDYRETNSGFPGIDYTDSDEGLSGYIGVGISFDLAENFRVGAEVNALAFNASLGAVETDHVISNFAVSAGFQF